jgi:hypothetical protein
VRSVSAVGGGERPRERFAIDATRWRDGRDGAGGTVDVDPPLVDWGLWTFDVFGGFDR